MESVRLVEETVPKTAAAGTRSGVRVPPSPSTLAAESKHTAMREIYMIERSVNGKPAVSKTVYAGSNPARSANFGTVAKKPGSRLQSGQTPVRVRPVPHLFR